MIKPKREISISSGILATSTLTQSSGLSANFLTNFDLNVITTLFEKNLRERGCFNHLPFDPSFVTTSFFTNEIPEEMQQRCRNVFSPYTTRFGDINPAVKSDFNSVAERIYGKKRPSFTTMGPVVKEITSSAKYKILWLKTNSGTLASKISTNFYVFNKKGIAPEERNNAMNNITDFLIYYFNFRNCPLQKEDIAIALRYATQEYQKLGYDAINMVENDMVESNKKLYEDYESTELDIFA